MTNKMVVFPKQVNFLRQAKKKAVFELVKTLDFLGKNMNSFLLFHFF